MRRNTAALPMPQTTGCALTHRLPSNTTTAARPPADLPPLPVEEARGGVRLHTANAKSPAVLLPPPWGRIGVGAAKKRTATKPHQTSSFTYTPSAQAYVKKTIGCALGRVCNSNFPPLRCGGGAGWGSPTYRQCKIARRSALSPVGEGWGGGSKKTCSDPTPSNILIYIHPERSSVCKLSRHPITPTPHGFTTTPLPPH